MTIEASKKILIVCTTNSTLSSSSQMTASSSSSSNKTGADVKELAYIYHYLRKQSAISSSDLTIAAPEATRIPFDPMSRKASENDPIVKEFLEDKTAMELFEKPEKLDSINATEYSCVIFPGGPGCVFDLSSTANSSTLSNIVTTIYNKNNGIVAAIGHGLAALVNVSSSSSTPSPSTSRESWLKNRTVTCNTTEEEKDMQLDKALPFLLEQKLKEIGAKFQKGDKFQSYVVVDERLITGQNRNSVKEWMETVTKELKKHQKKQ